MEALSMVSSVTTVVQIANDITGAVKAVSQNKESCEKLAERVEGIGELLKELGDGSSRSSSPSTATTAATRSLVTRLERSLRRALVLVRSCQVISSRVYGLVAGSWQTDQFDEVNAEIDRCVLDLSLALIAGIDRNRKLNDPHAVTPPSRAHARRRRHRSALTVDMTTAQDDDEEQIAAAASARDDGVGEDEKNGALICYGEQDVKDKKGATAAGQPPPSYGYYYYLHCHCARGLAGGGHYHQQWGGHCHCAAAGHYSPSYPWYTDSVDIRYIFSDENPNSCSIM